MAFFRTKKAFILLCVFIGLAIFDPLMIRGMGSLMESMSDVYDDFGMDVSDMVTMLGSNASLGVSSLISDLALAGMIVFLLLINGFAGGEQKKRSIIIPRSSGLNSFSYIMPKFIVYPVAAFALIMLSVLVTTLVSIAVFEVNDLSVLRVFVAGLLLGVNFMMYTCFHLCLGTATGKAGLSAGICIGASILVPGFFSVMSIGLDGNLIAYNPFALTSMAQNALYFMPDIAEMIITVVVALGIMFIVYLLALFAQNVKKIDNTGNEILI
jgi:hypothetical protein